MKTNNKKNIVLCGFMGSGKTTIGSALAKLLGYKFIDLDRYIEKKTKKTVSEIFDTYSEAYFRALEHKFSKRLSRKKGLVIALGGGTVLNPENTEVLKKSGSIIYLNVDADTVKARLNGDKTRPLLYKDKNSAITNLLELREPIYSAAADFTVDATKTKTEIINDILNIEKL